MRCLSILLMLAQAFLPTPAQSQRRDSTEPPEYAVREAYEVYSAIFESVFTEHEQLVILNETFPHKCGMTPNKGAITPTGAAADYVAVNAQRFRLQRNFQVSKPYQLISIDALTSLTSSGPWDKFFAAYPKSGGYINLSAVGFNQSKTRAVVAYDLVRGLNSGNGEFRALQKVDGKWVPDAVGYCKWIY
jgi:hypothetical protein